MAHSLRKVRQTTAQDVQQCLAASGTAKHFGFEVAEAEPGRVVLRMKVQGHHKQVHGVVHGGVLAALADTAAGMATYTSNEGRREATIEMKINYLEAITSGTVTADARVIRTGKHIAVVDCEVRDDNERLVAKALMTFYVGPFGKRQAKRTRPR